MSLKPKIAIQFIQDSSWVIASCSQFPEACGQGATKKEAEASLKRAIEALRLHEKLKAAHGS